MRGRQLLAAANVAMLVAFLGFAAVQWNDPDWLRWMAIYALAAVACALRLAGGLPAADPLEALPWVLAASVGLAALVWAALWAPAVISNPAVAHLFSSYQMMAPGVEEVREMLGLLIVAAWMAVLVVIRWRPAATPLRAR